MLNQPTFYHATTKNAITIFGSLFNNISLTRFDEKTNKVKQTLRVPLSYAPKDKYIARTLQEPDIDGSSIGVTLPRMAFEIKGLRYDSSRKLNSNNRNTSLINGNYSRQYNPVPYNVQVDLYVYVKNQEDGLQIVEQILPMFTPVYTVAVNTVPEMGIKYDLPIVMDNVSYEDNYDGDYTTRREIIWTLSFTMQLNYYGPVDASGSGIIKRTEVSFFNDKQMTIKFGEIDAEVSPFSANENDPHIIVDTIEGF